jgi:hypothetical protein
VAAPCSAVTAPSPLPIMGWCQARAKPAASQTDPSWLRCPWTAFCLPADAAIRAGIGAGLRRRDGRRSTQQPIRFYRPTWSFLRRRRNFARLRRQVVCLKPAVRTRSLKQVEILALLRARPCRLHLSPRSRGWRGRRGPSALPISAPAGGNFLTLAYLWLLFGVTRRILSWGAPELALV